MASRPRTDTSLEPPGPHPSVIVVARSYLDQNEISEYLSVRKTSGSAEASTRISGINYIDSVRKASNLPYRTFATGAMYYNRFRLLHSESSADYRDAAIASLFAACKVEDTLKKSREILCAAYNLKSNNPADHTNPDDPIFEQHSKVVLGLERIILEGIGFDFRTRDVHRLAMKHAKALSYDRATVARTTWDMCFDAYRTFAPFKLTPAALALACLELSARLHDADLAPLSRVSLARFSVDRSQIMEGIMDLLDLYQDHRGATAVGPSFAGDAFIGTRIALNQEATAAGYPRYNVLRDTIAENNAPVSTSTSTSPATPQASERATKRQKTSAGATPNGETSVKVTTRTAPDGTRSTTRQASPQSPGHAKAAHTWRFMLDPDRARREKAEVKRYFTVEEYEEYEDVSD